MKAADMQVTLLDHMGDDLAVVNAARVSFEKESTYECWCHMPNGVPTVCTDHRRNQCGVLAERDTKLIEYLAKHGHWTPFGHTAVKLRIKAPIFVARQLFKHKVGFVENEVSRRYVDSEPEFYVPEVWRKRAPNVKQGSSDEAVDINEDGDGPYLDGDDWFSTEEALLHSLRFASGLYDHLLAKGVCPEQARMVLPQSMMTQWIWTGNVSSYARVCNLRLDPHAQDETRQVAQQISDLIEPLFPVSWKALTTHG